MSFNNDTDSYMESDENDTIDLDDSDDSDSNISLSNDLKFQPFKVITSDDVVNKMNAEIKDVSVVLHVSFFFKSNNGKVVCFVENAGTTDSYQNYIGSLQLAHSESHGKIRWV